MSERLNVGVFIPIGNNGWLVSTTSPQYLPSFDLNREIVQRAERHGLDFALSMIKLRGFGGESRFWDYNLESFTLMAGIAAVTRRIKLFASVAVLTMPPAIVARMAATIDSIAPGRFGVNIVSGWARAEYDQMGLWPGEAHFARRYEFCSEYVQVMKELWENGRSDFKGQFFTMDDCRLEPRPSAPIDIVCAGQSPRGMEFACTYGDYNFCTGEGLNEPLLCAPKVAELAAASNAAGRGCAAYVLFMVIAAETDGEAMAKWQTYKEGVDLDAISWRSEQASRDAAAAATSTAQRLKWDGDLSKPKPDPTTMGKFIGSYETVAKLMDELATIEGLGGVMLTFDDFVQGVEDFGVRIQPLMRSRQHVATLTA